MPSSGRERIRSTLKPLSYDAQASLLRPKAEPALSPTQARSDGKGIGDLGAGVRAATVTTGDLEFLLAWNSNADLTRLLAFSTPGITAFGVALIAQLAKGGPDDLRGYPNLTPEQWRWIRETGHPFAIGNYWEQNSRGQPLVFTNVYGHGTLGIINMAVADRLFPNSPLLALVAASLMYTNFELFGEGSVRAPYEPNDFFISNVIPIIGSQAVADFFHLDQKIPMSTVASAQALVFALCSGKKMTKTDWLALAGYPVLAKLVEVLPIFRGRSTLLDETLDHLATTFGFSKGIGGYTGLTYSQPVGEVEVSTGVGVGPGGQRANVRVSGHDWSASAYAERAYDETGQAQPRFGVDVSVALSGPAKTDLEKAKDWGKKKVAGHFGTLKGSPFQKDLKDAINEVEKELAASVDRCRTREEVQPLVSAVAEVFKWFGPLTNKGKNDYENLLSSLRMVASRNG